MAMSSWMLRSASSSKRRKGSEISRKLPIAKPWCSTKISAISWISVNWFWILSGLVIGTKSRNSAWACSVCRYSVNWSLTLLNSNWSKIFVFIAPIITHLTIGGVEVGNAWDSFISGLLSSDVDWLFLQFVSEQFSLKFFIFERLFYKRVFLK